MSKHKCGNCSDPQGPFKRGTPLPGMVLCKDLAACGKRRAKTDKARYGEEGAA